MSIFRWMCGVAACSVALSAAAQDSSVPDADDHRHGDPRADAAGRDPAVDDRDRSRNDRSQSCGRCRRSAAVPRRARARPQRRPGPVDVALHPRRRQQSHARHGRRRAHQSRHDRHSGAAEPRAGADRQNRGRQRAPIVAVWHGRHRRRHQRDHAARFARRLVRGARLRRRRHARGQPQRRSVGIGWLGRSRRLLARERRLSDAVRSGRTRHRSRLRQPEREPAGAHATRRGRGHAAALAVGGYYGVLRFLPDSRRPGLRRFDDQSRCRAAGGTRCDARSDRQLLRGRDRAAPGAGLSAHAALRARRAVRPRGRHSPPADRRHAVERRECREPVVRHRVRRGHAHRERVRAGPHGFRPPARDARRRVHRPRDLRLTGHLERRLRFRAVEGARSSR